jgi:hypothetical protein
MNKINKLSQNLIIGAIMTVMAISGHGETMDKTNAIPALAAQPTGHQFVLIGDSHTVSQGSQFQAINAVIDRLQPPPEFVCLAGDHVWGWTEDEQALREQWRQWSSQNKSLLTHRIFHCTANHTVIGPRSAALYNEQFPNIPDNGPTNGKKLNYFVREGDFLLVVVNTAWNVTCTETGDKGGKEVDTKWVDAVLTKHVDARYKFVMGHHPVFPVNGFDGGWLVEAKSGKRLWELLVKHGVSAYLCAHIIAFDVQVRDGVLQITSGGGGFPYFFDKEDTEYHHCVQLAVEPNRLRCQTLDTNGKLREWLNWPLLTPASDTWQSVTVDHKLPTSTEMAMGNLRQARTLLLRFRGTHRSNGQQTFMRDSENSCRIGIENNRLCVRLKPVAKDDMAWFGPTIEEGPFDLQLAIHTGMGPGGVLFRKSDEHAWTSLDTKAWHGPTDASWPKDWSLNEDMKVSFSLEKTTLE